MDTHIFDPDGDVVLLMKAPCQDTEKPKDSDPPSSLPSTGTAAGMAEEGLHAIRLPCSWKDKKY